MATDPDWDTPVLRRATLALSISHVMETPEAIEQVIDRAITMLDQLIARRGTHARALALRGRLRFWKTLEFPDPALLRRAEADLHTALQQDAGMANAAGWLSDVFYSEANFHQARTWSERALQLDAYQLGATRIRHRLAMATFETGRDTAALRICREALDRFVDIPDNHGCVLEVLAFGDVAPDVSAAWQHLARLKATADGNQPGTSAYYEAATAAVIARAGLTDSAEHVLQRARARNAAAFGADGHLLWLEAAVRFRMGQTDTAAALLRSFMARGHPATDVILARRAVKPYLFTLYGDRPT